ncbi:MAG: 5'-nucleotidase C-terminal domain-containing protein [Bacteroidales bacterium]|nr:5'-nucleotidase C-terminal domain-containing protein [Bacteroidales bacterium]
MSKRIPLFFACLLLAAFPAASQQFTYKWTPVPMDTTWDAMRDLRATQIIGKYNPQVAPLQEIIGYSAAEYDKHRPESGLSNFAADVIKVMAEKKTGRKVDIALTNFGGIRTSLPKGAVRVYDIFSIFPFDNYLVVFDIKGSDLRRFLDRMISRRRVEALSGVEIVITGDKADKLNVAGAPLDDARTYTFATINFLMDGGDGVVLSDVAFNRDDTGVWIRDAIVEYLKEQMARGEQIVLEPDGRVVYTDWEERRR